jgi:serine/threonine-protein kinase
MEEGSLTVKIIDLGLAKTVDESASEAGITMPGAFAGTPEFASPEQFAESAWTCVPTSTRLA